MGAIAIGVANLATSKGRLAELPSEVKVISVLAHAGTDIDIARRGGAVLAPFLAGFQEGKLPHCAAGSDLVPLPIRLATGAGAEGKQADTEGSQGRHQRPSSAHRSALRN